MWITGKTHQYILDPSGSGYMVPNDPVNEIGYDASAGAGIGALVGMGIAGGIILGGIILSDGTLGPVEVPLAGLQIARAGAVGAGVGASLFGGRALANPNSPSSIPSIPMQPTLNPIPNPLFNPASSPFQLDPLLLDLDHNGIMTTSATNGVLFNYNNSSFVTNTAWVGGNDGMLVRDINNNGVIDNASELFGNRTVLSNGQLATNGFSALADLDVNHDGIIDSNDADFSQIKVLKSDGTLKSLSDLGIVSINLAATATNITDSQGNTQLSISSFTWSNGTTSQIGDYNLQINPSQTVDLQQMQISNAIASLPDALGGGNVHTLRQAMALDTTGNLSTLVESFANSTSVSNQNSLLDQILASWTGQISVTSNYHVANDDGKQYINPAHIAVLEQFSGQQYQNNNGNVSVYCVPASMLSQSYYQLKEYLYGELMAQTQSANYFNLIQSNDNNNGTYSLNLDQVINSLNNLAVNNPEQAQYDAAVFSRALNGLELQGVSNYTDFYTSISGLGADYKTALDQAGYTVVSATGANQTIGYSYWQREPQDAPATWLVGGQGNDDLQGGYNNDVLQGGPGDTLEGGYGNDTYLYSSGGGHEQIIEGGNYYSINNASGGNDTIKFGPGITQANTTFTNANGDLVITFANNTTDQLTVHQGLNNGQIGYRVENFAFSDGTGLTYSQVEALTGITGSNTTLTGNSDYDIFAFNRGNGHDTIVENGSAGDVSLALGYSGVPIAPGDITLSAQNNNVTLSVNGTADQILLQNELNQWGNNHVNNITFSDGTTWNYAQILNAISAWTPSSDGNVYGSDQNDTIQGGSANNTIYGGQGNDTMTAGTGNQHLDGGDGNDTLIAGSGTDLLTGDWGNDTLVAGTGTVTMNGGAGTNTYVWNQGDGQATITNNSSWGGDTLKLGTSGAAINAANVSLYAQGNNVTLQVNGSSNSILLQNEQDQWSSDHVDNIRFTDGTTWNYLQIQSHSVWTPAQNGNIYGSDQNDIIQGGTDNNTIYGGQGDDRIMAGTGNQTLDGGDGNDTLIAGSGTDLLTGGWGNDTLIAGTGTVTMNGGAGTNTYVWNQGDGQATITNNSSWGGDTLKLGTTGTPINPSDVSLYAQGNNVTLKVNGSSNSILLQNEQDRWNSDHVDNIQFSDGTTWNYAQMQSHLSWGMPGDTTINGSDQNDIIHAPGGNVTINAGTGTDTIYAGAGNDTVNSGWGTTDTVFAGTGDLTLRNGNYGNDTYRFGSGDGSAQIYGAYNSQASIQFDNSITENDIALYQFGNNVVIAYAGNSQITLNNQANGSDVQKVQLGNGDFMTDSDINSLIQNMSSYASDHGISLSNINDVKANTDLMAMVNGAWHH